jgi:Na+/H+ antiporter NhaC
MKLLIIRTLSLVIYTGLGTFGLSTGLGIEPVRAAIIAAVFPLIFVIRATAKGFINDGKLDQSEIDAAIHAGENAE